MPTEEIDLHRTPATTVYISNVSEDVWSFITHLATPAEQLHEINENAFLSDRDLLSCAGEDHMIVILPYPVDPDFLQYYLELFGNKNLRVLVPSHHTGQICEDILNDPAILEAIVAAANGSKRLVMTSYTTSFQFLKLVAHLRVQEGLTVSTPESPAESDAWTVNFFGSKSGIRQLAQQNTVNEPDFMLSPGLVTAGVHDTAQIAAKMYLKEKGVVIKTNKGHSGAGVLIFRPGDLPNDYGACVQKIEAELQLQPYWNTFPIVIEELVDINPNIGGGSPNAEFKITKSGKVELLYFCGMRVTRDGVFKGVEIHKDALADQVEAQIIDTGFFIGEQYSDQGYRGYYDVDLVAAKNGKLFITESNVRRTGGTHVYTTAVALFDKDFMYDVFTLSSNLYQLPGKKINTFNQLRTILEPILFTKRRKEGVVLAAANLLKNHQIAYIVFGQTKKRALELEKTMEDLLSHYG